MGATSMTFSHYLVTGKDALGRKWRKETYSFIIAWGINAYSDKRIWEVYNNGQRKLVN